MFAKLIVVQDNFFRIAILFLFKYICSYIYIYQYIFHQFINGTNAIIYYSVLHFYSSIQADR